MDLSPTELNLGSYEKSQRERIEKAIGYMRSCHEGQIRADQTPFFTHLIATARLVMEHFDASEPSVIAALLHDVVEDTDATIEEVKERFGDEVAFIVEGCTIDKGMTWEQSKEKVLRYGAIDKRVFLVKIADRWHNILTSSHMSKEYKVRTARETLDLHVSLCRKLGYKRQAELIERALEDLG